MTAVADRITDAIAEIDEILEREVSRPFSRAQQAADPAPHWRDLAVRLNRAGALAEWLADNTEA